MQKTIRLGDVAVFDHVEPDKAHALKVLEEAAEVYSAWQAWDECGFEEAVQLECRQALFEEIADTVQAVANLAYSLGCEDMRLDMWDCEDRNRRRGRITHGDVHPKTVGREYCRRFVFVPLPSPHGVLGRLKAKVRGLR